jgi:A/G-specific adenine glycosylase
MPQCSEKLESLPGIGKSTAGAILSLGFKLKAPILDGNAKRLLVRYFKVEEPIDSAKTMKNLWKIASENLPLKECDIYTQAIMDVGSLICKRKSPDCENCPLNKTCLSFKEGIQDLLPLKSPSKNKPRKQLYWLLLQNKEGEVLLENRTSKGVWKGLWTFLSFEKIELREEFIKRLPKGYEFIEQDLKLKHTFTHYKLDIDTTLVRLNEDFQNQDNNKVWFNNKELSEIGLPMPVTKILKDHIKDAQSFL